VIVVLLPGTGPVELAVTTCRSGQPFLLLYGGAGPHPVTGSGELLATTHHVCVLVPAHPASAEHTAPTAGRHSGTRGAPQRPDRALGLQDVTVTGNSIGGWTTAEIALPRSPRVSGSVLITAAIPDPPPGPCTVPSYVPAPHTVPSSSPGKARRNPATKEEHHGKDRA
jgi:pimeloyl-ACP methyl ester carboxylesterase